MEIQGSVSTVRRWVTWHVTARGTGEEEVGETVVDMAEEEAGPSKTRVASDRDPMDPAKEVTRAKTPAHVTTVKRRGTWHETAHVTGARQDPLPTTTTGDLPPPGSRATLPDLHRARPDMDPLLMACRPHQECQ